MVEEVRTMKLEVSPLQLAEWLIHGIAVIISLWQVDSVNDRTRRPIPRAKVIWERIGNNQGRIVIFLLDRFCRCPSGDPLYPLTRTGPVVPAHTGDDREQEMMSGKV
jgi:hypothetical protein